MAFSNPRVSGRRSGVVAVLVPVTGVLACNETKREGNEVARSFGEVRRDTVAAPGPLVDIAVSDRRLAAVTGDTIRAVVLYRIDGP